MITSMRTFLVAVQLPDVLKSPEVISAMAWELAGAYLADKAKAHCLMITYRPVQHCLWWIVPDPFEATILGSILPTTANAWARVLSND